MLADGGAALVDVRRQDIFAKGHVEGAVNIPMFQQLVCTGGFVVDTPCS